MSRTDFPVFDAFIKLYSGTIDDCDFNIARKLHALLSELFLKEPESFPRFMPGTITRVQTSANAFDTPPVPVPLAAGDHTGFVRGYWQARVERERLEIERMKCETELLDMAVRWETSLQATERGIRSPGVGEQGPKIMKEDDA